MVYNSASCPSEDIIEHDSLNPACPCKPTPERKGGRLSLKHHKVGPRVIAQIMREVKPVLAERRQP